MADWNRVDVLHIQIKIAYCARPTMTRSNIYIFIWRRRMAGWFIYLNKWTFKVSDGGPGDFFFLFFFFKSKIHLFSHSHSRADDYISSFLVKWFFFNIFLLKRMRAHSGQKRLQMKSVVGQLFLNHLKWSVQFKNLLKSF